MEGNQPYIVSARKYRPSTFASVVGQQTLTSTLKNAIDSGRLAQAYLFCGPRGVGKTSCARIFAKTINCLNPTPEGEACGECESCRAIERGNSFNIIELDAASNNSVDDIRSLTDQVNVPPSTGRYRVFIIDEVHMLSQAAFNAFLKTLEEPPKYVIFILATTEKHKVIPTILSRCQIYDFKRITIADITAHLGHVAQSEGIEAEESALGVIARKADGAMRDALSIFDQVTACSRGHITYRSAIESLNVLDYDYYFKLVDAFMGHDVQGALLLYKEIRDKGFDSLFFVNGLAAHIRDLMVAYTPQTAELLEVGSELATQYTTQARRLPIEWYYTALDILNDCDLNYRTVTDKRLHVELALIRLSRIGMAAMPQLPEGVTPQPAPTRQPQPATASQPATQPQNVQRPQPAATPHPATQRTATPTVPRTPRPTGVTAAPPRQTVRLSQPRQTQRPAQTQQPEQQPPQQPSEAPAQPPAGQPADKNPGQQKLQELWQQYIDTHGHSHIAVSAMRATIPSRHPDGTWHMGVPHSGMLTAMQSELAELTQFIRHGLGDDSFTLHVEISTAAERRRILSPREEMAQLMSENRMLKDFLESIEAEII